MYIIWIYYIYKIPWIVSHEPSLSSSSSHEQYEETSELSADPYTYDIYSLNANLQSPGQIVADKFNTDLHSSKYVVAKSEQSGSYSQTPYAYWQESL